MKEIPPYIRLVTLELEEEDAFKPKSLREWASWKGIVLKDVLMIAFLTILYIFSGAVIIFGIFNS
jgi:hypothetical protein